MISKADYREFSSGLAVRIPGFHCRWRTEISQAARHGQKKKKERKKEEKADYNSHAFFGFCFLFLFFQCKYHQV